MPKIPYFRQETEWSCGATCLRMVLAAMGIKKSEKQVIQLLKTNSRWGTNNASFGLFAEKKKWSYSVVQNPTYEELSYFFKNGYLIILNFHLEEEESGHFAVLEDFSSRSLTLLDPKQGRVCYSLKEFDRLWVNTHTKLSGKLQKWFFAVKK